MGREADVFTSLIGVDFRCLKQLRSGCVCDRNYTISPLPDTCRHEGSDPHSIYICHYQRLAFYANVVICVAIFHEFSRLLTFVNDVANFALSVGFCFHAFRTRDVHHDFVQTRFCVPVCLSV